MSALPKPEPEPTPIGEPAADADGWALLEGLRRRLDDQAVQNRKTQQQVTQLAESIGALVETQRRRSRWLNLNSFAAYLIFTLLCGGAFYFVYATRADAVVEQRDAAKRERDAATKRADDATAKLAAYETADRAKREKESQVMEVDAALRTAAAAFKAGRHAEAIAPLEAALDGEAPGARASSMRYYLGVAYAKGAQLDKAIEHLTVALEVEADHEDVRFQLASALDRSGAYAKARAEYDRFATAHPQSSFAMFAMRRSATLARMPAQKPAAPPAAAPAALTTPAAPPPAALTTPAAPPKPAAAPAKPVWKPRPVPPKKPAAAAPATESTESPPSPLPPPTPSPSPSTSPTQPMSSTNLETPKPPKAEDTPTSMPAPTPWPSQPAPPERTPAPEVTTPAPPPPPAPPPLERFDAIDLGGRHTDVGGRHLGL